METSRFPETIPRWDRKTAEAYTEGHKPYPCLPGRVSFRGKRCFDEDVSFAMRERLTSDPIPSTLRRSLVELIKDHLDRKNILIQVFHPTDLPVGKGLERGGTPG